MNRLPFHADSKAVHSVARSLHNGAPAAAGCDESAQDNLLDHSLPPAEYQHLTAQEALESLSNNSHLPALAPLQAPAIPDNLPSAFPKPTQYHMGQFIRQEFPTFVAVALPVLLMTALYAGLLYRPSYVSNAMVMIRDSAVTSRYVVPEMYHAVQTTSSSAANPVLNMMGLLQSTQVGRALWEAMRAEAAQQQQPASPGRSTQTARQMEPPTRLFGWTLPSSLWPQPRPALADTPSTNGQRAGTLPPLSRWLETTWKHQKLLKMKNLPGTDLISLEFRWEDPRQAQAGLAAVLKAFQDQSLELNRVEHRTRSHYLAQQVAAIGKQLREVRLRKSQYKASHTTVNLSRETDELAKSMMDIENQLGQTQAMALSKTAQLARLRHSLGMGPDEGLRGTALGLNKSLAKLYDQQYQLSQTVGELSATLTDKHPRMVAIKSQMSANRAAISRETRRTLGRAASEDDVPGAVADATRGTVIGQMATIQAEAVGLKAHAQRLRGRLTEIRQKMMTMPQVEASLSQIEQDERALAQALDGLHQKLFEARIKEAESLSNIFVVDAPTRPLRSQFPRQTEIWFLGLVLALVLGSLAVATKRVWLPRWWTSRRNRAGTGNPTHPAGGRTLPTWGDFAYAEANGHTRVPTMARRRLTSTTRRPIG
jgi:uncharacterized protein involved in exopolysaccharide biosynthesis